MLSMALLNSPQIDSWVMGLEAAVFMVCITGTARLGELSNQEA